MQPPQPCSPWVHYAHSALLPAAGAAGAGALEEGRGAEDAEDAEAPAPSSRRRVASEARGVGGWSAWPPDVNLPNLPEFHARGGYLQMNGKRVYVKGISWFGFEGDSAVVDGLWKRPVEAACSTSWRRPTRLQRLRLRSRTTTSCAARRRPPRCSRPSRTRSPLALQILELVVQAAARRLLDALDLHRLDSAVWPDPNGLWYNEKVSLIDRAARVAAARPALLPPVERLRRRPVQRAPRRHVGHRRRRDRQDTAAETLANGVLRQCSRWVTLVEGIGQGGRTLPE